MKVVSALLGAALALVLSLPAHAAGIVPLSGSQQFDKDSSPPAYLVGGRLYVYKPGTTTCATVYTDFTLQFAHPCPIVLPQSGRIPGIYAADGSVRLRLTAAPIAPATTGVLQFDDDNVAIVTAAAGTGGSTPIPDSTQIFGTRDFKIRFDDQPVSGYVRLNGRTIGSASSGATERASADTQSLFLQLWPYSNISVVSGKGGSAVADFAANKQLVLPDMAGRLLGAMDDLGNGAQGRITSATVAGPTAVGATGGVEKHALITPELPPITPAGTNSTITPAGTVTVVNGTNLVADTGGGSKYGGGGVGSAVTVTASFAGTPVTPIFTGTPVGGTSQVFGTISPVMLLMIYIKL